MATADPMSAKAERRRRYPTARRVPATTFTVPFESHQDLRVGLPTHTRSQVLGRLDLRARIPEGLYSFHHEHGGKHRAGDNSTQAHASSYTRSRPRSYPAPSPASQWLGHPCVALKTGHRWASAVESVAGGDVDQAEHGLSVPPTAEVCREEVERS